MSTNICKSGLISLLMLTGLPATGSSAQQADAGFERSFDAEGNLIYVQVQTSHRSISSRCGCM
jgi:hypothetical protein